MSDLKNSLQWVLEDAAESELEQLETGTLEIFGETEEGIEGSFEIDVTELFSQAAKRIELLEKAIKYSTSYLDDNKLNSIGHGSKAHKELLFAITS